MDSVGGCAGLLDYWAVLDCVGSCRTVLDCAGLWWIARTVDAFLKVAVSELRSCQLDGIIAVTGSGTIDEDRFAANIAAAVLAFGMKLTGCSCDGRFIV